MKKHYLSIIILILIAGFANNVVAVTLEDYPDFFKKNGEFDVKVVIPSSDLQFHLVESFLHDELNLPGGVIPMPKDIDSLEQNLVLVGNACDNALVDELRGFPENCRADLKEKQGRIELIETEGGHFIIIVEGYDMLFIPELANILKNHEAKGTNFVFESQEPPKTNTLLLISLRKDRLNHLTVDGIEHTFELVGWESPIEAIIEIDGEVQPQSNDVCNYDADDDYAGDRVTLNLKSCKKPEVVQEEPQEEIKPKVIDEPEEGQETVQQEEKSFFKKIIDWILNLFK